VAALRGDFLLAAAARAGCEVRLRDVDDAVGVPVHRELMRVARSGYVEVPSRLEEQTMALQGDWVGWSHHRWLIDASRPDPTPVADQI